MGFFDDPKRSEIRTRQNIGFLTDYLIRSEATDYYKLRLLVNTFLGVLICSSIYHAGWNHLNFGDFENIPRLIVKWSIICLSTFAFTVSPVFRCALLCVLVGAFGKQGQYPFTMLVVSNLHEGPITNMLANYEITTDIVVCHIELQSKIVANRVALLTGPLEQIVEKVMAKGTRAMKRVARETRALITPFIELLTPTQKTKTDEKEEMQREQVEDIEKRKQNILKLWEKSMGRKLREDDAIVKDMLPPQELVQNISFDEPPIWKNFKTSIVQKFAAKMSAKCEEMFNAGIDKCKALSGELVTTCKKVIFWPMDLFICPKLGIENVCESAQRRVQSMNLCRSQFQKTDLNPSVEQDLLDVMNLTKKLEDEAKISLHTIRVESPRVEFEYRLSDLKIKVRSIKMIVKNILGVSKQIFQAFFIYFIYQIFRDSVAMIKKYRTEISFNNNFATSDFWAIDEFRKLNNQTHLSKFSKPEKRDWEIVKVFGAPTRVERLKMIQPFLKWFALVMIVVVLSIIDYYMFTFLDSVVESAKTQVKHSAKSSAEFRINGDGMVADFLRTMTTANETLEIDQTLSNEHCLMKPLPPNFSILIYWLAIPLIISFVFQVLFSFVIRRIILNYFLPFMFPKRSRARLIYFYNKCILNREKHRKDARARIRFMTDRKKFEMVEKTDFLQAGSFLKTNFLDRIFRTGKCLICQEKNYGRRLKYCAQIKCQSVYCQDCIEDNFGKCYACQVTNKEVDEQKSRMMEPDVETNDENNFLNYEDHLNRIKMDSKTS